MVDRPSGVFISYRREDAGPYARLLKVLLDERLLDIPVFMDLDSIEVGTDFAEAIESALRSCVVLVALIGPRWLTAADADGQRRLDDPDDQVRFEIQAALEQGARVIPVLVDGSLMPRQHQLPTGLAKLARLNAMEMSYSRLEYDETRLLNAVIRVLADNDLPARVLTAMPARPDYPAGPRLMRRSERPDRQTLRKALGNWLLQN